MYKFSLDQRALLVSVSLKSIGNSRRDRNAEREVAGA